MRNMFLPPGTPLSFKKNVFYFSRVRNDVYDETKTEKKLSKKKEALNFTSREIKFGKDLLYKQLP